MADRLGSRSMRAISGPGGEVRYELERKRVRNINLRVRRDGSVYASAAPGVPAASVDDFVRKKEAFIRAAQREFARRESAPPPRLFQSGERFCFLGQTLLLRVEAAPRSGAVVEGGELLLRVRGADMLNGTPVYDIKPYVPFVDGHPEATGGFAGPAREHALRVEFPETLLQAVPERAREALKAVSYTHLDVYTRQCLYSLP